ncbi:hypothetical protein T4B_1127 [Trichinella pseudospiralis]|uniref:Uncharacterized protein n=1 Tax=Trichinella pseudospiralis TaxID=6337 RepID=A0A0V1I3U3_TRIPS|nr:hypothetical protein T4B_1127 [Trichinella pseudospiralis]KRZ29038.1 hypothetical protein T4C_5882 [Trichinella pseudospiralis]
MSENDANQTKPSRCIRYSLNRLKLKCSTSIRLFCSSELEDRFPSLVAQFSAKLCHLLLNLSIDKQFLLTSNIIEKLYKSSTINLQFNQDADANGRIATIFVSFYQSHALISLKMALFFTCLTAMKCRVL